MSGPSARPAMRLACSLTLRKLAPVVTSSVPCPSTPLSFLPLVLSKTQKKKKSFSKRNPFCNSGSALLFLKLDSESQLSPLSGWRASTTSLPSSEATSLRFHVFPFRHLSH
ncbi:hypothetical protein T439DRAFT_106033 [Meredithblackwellia eburnea MCA 4105]